MIDLPITDSSVLEKVLCRLTSGLKPYRVGLRSMALTHGSLLAVTTGARRNLFAGAHTASRVAHVFRIPYVLVTIGIE